MLLPDHLLESPRPPLARERVPSVPVLGFAVSGQDVLRHAEERPRDRCGPHDGRRALPPALAMNSCGCFLPDLTRFTTSQCGEARHGKTDAEFGARGWTRADDGLAMGQASGTANLNRRPCLSCLMPRFIATRQILPEPRDLPSTYCETLHAKRALDRRATGSLLPHRAPVRRAADRCAR